MEIIITNACDDCCEAPTYKVIPAKSNKSTSDANNSTWHESLQDNLSGHRVTSFLCHSVT